MTYQNKVYLKLKLSTGNTINIETISDLMKCCTKGKFITIGKIRFKKKIVTHVEFGDGWDLNYIPDKFLAKFKGLIVLGQIPRCINRIENGFLKCCKSFNWMLDLSNIIYIGSDFLFECELFNQMIDISGITVINRAFLMGCKSFNQQITFSKELMIIKPCFLADCESFNQMIDIPDSVTRIGYGFMRNNFQFNNTLILSDNINKILPQFMFRCESFNQPLLIPDGVVTIKGRFMEHCTSFNQVMIIPNSVTKIGDGFMCECIEFDQIIQLPSSVYKIGAYFMSGCRSFSRSFSLPNDTKIGKYFLNNCDSFTDIYVDINFYKQIPEKNPCFITSMKLGSLSIMRGFSSQVNESFVSKIDNILSPESDDQLVEISEDIVTIHVRNCNLDKEKFDEFSTYLQKMLGLYPDRPETSYYDREDDDDEDDDDELTSWKDYRKFKIVPWSHEMIN